jgi:mRNA interferase RelE/StbE
MRLVYTPRFEREIIKLPRIARRQIDRAIHSCKADSDIRELPSLKKLQGYADTYRIRAGRYRLGVFIVGGEVTFISAALRKDFYRYFP